MNNAYDLSLNSFSTLNLGGNSKYSIENDRVIIEIGEIANYMQEGLLSGTLSVELWALSEPYQGGIFSGHALAGTTIGELNSQHSLLDCRYDLLFNQPPEGTWYFTLMLREWNGFAYVTRDYVNFDLPYQQSTLTASNTAKSKNVIHLAYKSANEPHAETSEIRNKTAQNPSERLEKQVLHTDVTDVETASSVKQPTLATPVNKTKKGKLTKVAKKVVVDKETVKFLKAVSALNVEKLSGIKGIYASLADKIMAGQPYHDLASLMKIKGLGKKKLEAIRHSLTQK